METFRVTSVSAHTVDIVNTCKHFIPLEGSLWSVRHRAVIANLSGIEGNLCILLYVNYCNYDLQTNIIIIVVVVVVHTAWNESP